MVVVVVNQRSCSPSKQAINNMCCAGLPARSVGWKPVGAAFCVGVLLMFLADLAFPDQPAASTITCADAWCATDGFDTALTSALAHGDFKAAAMVSHVLNFGVSPLIAVSSIVFFRSMPGSQQQLGSSSAVRRRQVLQDLVILLACVLGAIGLNAFAKTAARRQRPCFHYGRQNETEAEGHPKEQWVSFYSGDATFAAASYGAGLALAVVRRRNDIRALAWLGGAVALTGSLLRVVAFMHWMTDVLVGDVAGFLLGFGPPLLLFWNMRGRGKGEVPDATLAEPILACTPLLSQASSDLTVVLQT